MPPRRAKIFFVAYGGSHIRSVLPVVEMLETRGHECIVLALTSAQLVMRQLNKQYIGFADLVEAGDEDALAKGKELARDLPTPPIDERETYAYLGLSYHDLELRFDKEEATRLYAERGRQCFEPVGVLKRALLKYKPDMVVVTSSPRAEKAAAHAAKEFGISAVCMLDFYDSFCTWAANPAYADKLLAFSAMNREYLIAKGRPAADIVVTGNPAMDRLSDPQWQTKGVRWRQDRGWENKKVIFWASQPEPPPNDDLSARIDKAVLATLQKHDDWRLLIRFHPSEAVRFTEAGPHVYYSPKSEDLTPLLFACDACMVMTSTVGLEAAMIGKPLVTVDLSVNAHLAPFTRLGISISAKRLEDLDNCLQQALERGIFRWAGLPAVGQATQAVVDVIVSMLDNEV